MDTIRIELADVIQLAIFAFTVFAFIAGAAWTLFVYLARRFRGIDTRQEEQAVELATIKGMVTSIYEALPPSLARTPDHRPKAAQKSA